MPPQPVNGNWTPIAGPTPEASFAGNQQSMPYGFKEYGFPQLFYGQPNLTYGSLLLPGYSLPPAPSEFENQGTKDTHFGTPLSTDESLFAIQSPGNITFGPHNQP